jgi:hypothetical protein
MKNWTFIVNAYYRDSAITGEANTIVFLNGKDFI